VVEAASESQHGAFLEGSRESVAGADLLPWHLAVAGWAATSLNNPGSASSAARYAAETIGPVAGRLAIRDGAAICSASRGRGAKLQGGYAPALLVESLAGKVATGDDAGDVVGQQDRDSRHGVVRLGGTYDMAELFQS